MRPTPHARIPPRVGNAQDGVPGLVQQDCCIAEVVNGPRSERLRSTFDVMYWRCKPRLGRSDKGRPNDARSRYIVLPIAVILPHRRTQLSHTFNAAPHSISRAYQLRTKSVAKREKCPDRRILATRSPLLRKSRFYQPVCYARYCL